MNIEILGTVASIIIFVSFLVEGEIKIRLINIVGTLVFFAYGIMTNAFSVWFLNGGLLLIHFIKIRKLLREAKNNG